MTSHSDRPLASDADAAEFKEDLPADASGPQGGNALHTHPSFSRLAQLYEVVAEIRRHPHGATRADLIEELGLSRSVVDRRLAAASRLGLITSGGRAESTGGRAPDLWAFKPDGGRILTLSLSYTHSTAALHRLDGTIEDRRDWESGMTAVPEEAIAQSVGVLRALIHQCEQVSGKRPWGVGVTLPSSVDFRDGSLVPPVASSVGADEWIGLPLRTRLEQALRLPVWVDDEVNAMALYAATRIGAPQDLLYIRLALGIGMGIVSNGLLNRGAGAVSGEIAHIQVAGQGRDICRCGRRNCLETAVGGKAIAATASQPAALGASAFLRNLQSSEAGITMIGVYRGAAAGDRVCTRVVTEAADLLASVLAVLSTSYNPAEIVIGGDATAGGSLVAQAISSGINRRLLPVTAQRLRVRMGEPDDASRGIARLVADQLIRPRRLALWMAHGTPTDVDRLIGMRRQDI